MTEDVRDAVPGDVAGEGAEGSQLPVEEPQPEAPAGEEPAPAAPAAEEAVDWKDRWLRSEAELQNFRRRAVRDREEAVARAQESVLLDVIGLLDDLERALSALSPEQAGEPWAQGVALTAQRMRDTLARWDVTEIEAAGRPFDPSVHEAVLEIDAPDGVAPGAVAQVVHKGYRRGGRALRAARVVVARSPRAGQ